MQVGDDLPAAALIDFSVNIGNLRVDFVNNGDVHDVYTDGKLRHPNCKEQDIVNVIRWYYQCQQENSKLRG